MQKRVSDMIGFCISHIVTGQRNCLAVIITLTGTSSGMVKHQSPSGELMSIHQLISKLKNSLKRAL